MSDHGNRPLDAPTGCVNGLALGFALWCVLAGPAVLLWVACR